LKNKKEDIQKMININDNNNHKNKSKPIKQHKKEQNMIKKRTTDSFDRHERRKKIQRLYREKNKEKFKKYMKEHREYLKLSRKEYVLKNKEKIQQIRKKYELKNKEQNINKLLIKNEELSKFDNEDSHKNNKCFIKIHYT
jgi:hypothetical protein